MASLFRLLLAVTLVLAAAVPRTRAGDPASQLGVAAAWMLSGTEPLDLAGDDEFALDSEIHRRFLASTNNYISYKAMSANSVPCSISGQSYYNCQPGAAVNPYTRPCNEAYRCRTG